MSAAEVLAEFAPALARVNPAFSPDWVTDAWSFAAPFAQPIATVDYREHIPPFATPVGGLWVASMSRSIPTIAGKTTRSTSRSGS